MKKLIIATLTVLATTLNGYSRPGPGPAGHHAAPHPPMHHFSPAPVHHGGYSTWGRGGRNFWPGFVGGVVGGALYSGVYGYPYQRTTVVYPTTTVVQPTVVQPTVVQPTVVQPTTIVQQPRQIWVEGQWVNQQQPNGTVVRVWQAGHWETAY